MLCETCYISCNANQTPTIADWGQNNLICYGSCNAVMIYDQNFGSGGKVTQTLTEHKKRINSVKWITNQSKSPETELISGSTDNTAIVWTLKDDNYVFCSLVGHESTVNIVDGVYKGPGQENLIVATFSMDSTLKIWFRSLPNGEFRLNQSINYGRSLCTSLTLSFLTQNQPILACGSDNSSIDVYTQNLDTQFSKSIALKGHEDWVRGLDFTKDENGDLLLASSSQDYYIRIWRITQVKIDSSSQTEQTFTAEGTKYRVYVDSVLTGHEGWIYSVHWNPSPGKLQLLSSSLDKSMIIWEIDASSNLWLEKIRVGDVGGNTLGFYGGLFDPKGDTILGHSYHGAFHVWRNAGECEWRPLVTVGGHFDAVTDLAWPPTGDFLVTVGADQTTRIHAPWPNAGKTTTWHEIARPQVHGYDLSALALLSRYKFASSAEEKVIRTFEAPWNFIENFGRICKVDGVGKGAAGAKGASVPSLGLSNKAVFDDSNEGEAIAKDGYEGESHFKAIVLNEPPTEETLVENTLWPEVQKLYGHGYEVYALAASPDGRFLASACKATTQEHAAILLWETANWKLVQKLSSHTLTVVQMSFSPDSQHLLSVSRDRRWSIFRRNSAFDSFALMATTDKKTAVHTRIIWCCAWSHDSKYFATGSRDGKVCVWRRNKDKIAINDTLLGEYELASNHYDAKNDSITALAFAPEGFMANGDEYLLAVGFESGAILGCRWTPQGWEHVFRLDKREAHHLNVKRLAFRPILGVAGESNPSSRRVVQLASCSSDHSVKIYNIVNTFLNKET